MRKLILLLLLVSLLVLPTSAQAQSDVRFGQLTIQLWPEYDSPEMLVMYSFVIAADSTLPAEVQIRIPADANLNAVAKVEEGRLVNVPYDAPVKEGDWVTITMTVEDIANHRVEYYAPLEKNGDTRNYDYFWTSDYAADSLVVQVQQPPTSSAFSATPLLPNVNQTSGGITYHDLDVGELAAGSEFSLSLSYEKSNDDLTVSSMPVEVGGSDLPATGETPRSFSAEDALPYVLVGIGILLIAGGLIYFFSAGRREPAPKQRKRHAPNTANSGGNIYCHECGSRASSGDKFCRSCGAKLRI